jgi:putative Holliday junction resolvase
VTRHLALDVGDRRVGLAVSDELGIIASPLTVMRRKSKAEDFARIARLVREQCVGALVIGHPLDSEGLPGPQARRIERYATGLSEALAAEGLDVPVEFCDESLSTRRAQEVMIASGRNAADRRARDDAVAAAVILQDFLESNRAAGQESALLAGTPARDPAGPSGCTGCAGEDGS